ncbi:hypothetical protein Syun_012760 [Stephania yunnanensis]|uniref:Uncharacterized protein n=1 Tax=Stephania yunnanensis TaxID=152371 RepID=A0AAP0K0T0_9MAGN
MCNKDANVESSHGAETLTEMQVKFRDVQKMLREENEKVKIKRSIQCIDDLAALPKDHVVIRKKICISYRGHCYRRRRCHA